MGTGPPETLGMQTAMQLRLPLTQKGEDNSI